MPRNPQTKNATENPTEQYHVQNRQSSFDSWWYQSSRQCSPKVL